jgi:outer membrane murein-binding lipoprotein Lpp
MDHKDHSRLHALLNFWGLILAAVIGAVAVILTAVRARESSELDQLVSELKAQVERAHEETRLSRAEAQSWMAEADRLKGRLDERPAPGNPTAQPASGPSSPEDFPSIEDISAVATQAEFRAVASTRMNQISYEVVSCAGQGQVKCALMITSHNHDRWFHIDPRTSFIIDDSGNQYSGYEAQIARKVSDRWQELKTLLVSGVTVKASIVFVDVRMDAHARRLSLLELSVSSSTDGDHHVQLRNVPLINPS